MITGNVKEEVVEHDNGVNNIINDIGSEKVVVFDIDSLVYFTLYSGKDEFGNKNPEYTTNDLDYLKSKLAEMVMKHLNKIDEYFVTKSLFIFIRGKNNFRKDIYPEYKSNRPTPNPLNSYLYDYLKEEFQAIESHGCETDDMCYTIAKKLNFDCIILSSDKDLYQMPCIFYDYKKDYWCRISEKEAKFNLYRQLVIGDASDGVNLTQGLGKSYFNKNFNIDMTDEQYEENLLKAFIKVWKDETIAKEKIELAKQLLTLKDMDDND